MSVLLFLLACKGDDGLIVRVSPEHEALFADFLAPIPHEGLSLDVADDPTRGVKRGRVAVVADLDCVECYSIEGDAEEGWVVHGDAPLGVQYGLAALLEGYGFRFHHPYDTFVPEALEAGEVTREGSPSVARRGIHLHTLHPIEGYWDVWEPGEENLARAGQVVDWVVKNRGDHLQWVALDDIQDGDASAWEDHTRQIVDAAHARGVTVGLGIQLFGVSNLQLAWDLLDTTGSEAEQRAAMADRLGGIAGLEWDTLNLSFGEFSGVEPETFVASVDLAYAEMQAAMPGVEVDATIHVGNNEELQVEYQGEELQYYFLVQYADPGIVPWVHTTMFYDLFEDAGGAYDHDEFSDHREFLLEKVQAGEEVGYFPESAYWVAFDNSVPLYLPLYVRSRWVDLDGVRAVGDLPQHVLFSSGWEWGYWQNDVATLRMAYDAQLGWEAAIGEMFAPMGGGVGESVVALTEVQHAALLEGRLAAYLAGRDVLIDAGDRMDIRSQPDRVGFDEVTPDFAPTVDALAALATDTRAVLDGFSTSEDRWVTEARDGVEVDALRAEFAAAAWGAALAHVNGSDPTERVEAAAAALESARVVVARRHGAFHDPETERLITPVDNATIYDFGYLTRADELCYWERELAQLRNLVEGASEEVPGCLF